MPKTKKAKTTDVDTNDLAKKLEALSLELRDLRFKIEGSKSKNVKKAQSLKKEIARILTEINKNNRN